MLVALPAGCRRPLRPCPDARVVHPIPPAPMERPDLASCPHFHAVIKELDRLRREALRPPCDRWLVNVRPHTSTRRRRAPAR